MRLIDADALMKVIREHDYPLRSHFNSTDNGMFTLGIQQAIDEAPTVDAVPVVRCSECISHGTLTNGNLFCGKRFTGVYGEYHVVKPDDYCSYGKRREK